MWTYWLDNLLIHDVIKEIVTEFTPIKNGLHIICHYSVIIEVILVTINGDEKDSKTEAFKLGN